MSIRIAERPKQKATVEFTEGEVTREFWAYGSTDKVQILQAIYANIPQAETTMDLLGNAIPLSLNSMNAEEGGGGAWTVTAKYKNSPDEFRLTITSGVQSTKVFQAQQTIEVYDCIDGSKGSVLNPTTFQTTNVPPLSGAIGTGSIGSRTVEGLEVEIAKLELSISKKTKSSQLSAAYAMYVASVTPSVNIAAWHFVWQNQLFAFATGCLKFRGARINQTGDSDFEIVHDFSFSKGLTQTAANWLAGANYASGDQAVYLGHLFQSINDANTGNAPAIYSAWRPATTYTIGQQITYGGSLWTSLTNANIGNDPTLDGGIHWQFNSAFPWLDLGPTPSTFTVGSSAPIVKEGWQYADPIYRPAVAGGATLMVPAGVAIFRVFDYSDFYQLDCF